MPQIPESTPIILKDTDQISKKGNNNRSTKRFATLGPILALSAIVASCNQNEDKITTDLTQTINKGLETRVMPTQWPKTPTVDETYTHTEKSPQIEIESKFEVIIDQNLQGQMLESQVTAEQLKLVFEAELSKLPQVLPLEVHIFVPNPNAQQNYLKGGNHFVAGDETHKSAIYIDKTTRTVEMAISQLYHDWVHSIDPDENGAALRQVLTEEEVNTLLALKEKATTDPTWGIPEGTNPIDLLFTKEMQRATIYPSPNEDLDVLIPSAKKYALGILLSGRTSPDDPRENPVLDLLAPSIQEIHNYSESKGLSKERSEYLGFAETYTDNQEFIDSLRAENPLIDYAVGQMLTSPDKFSALNLNNLGSTPSEAHMTGFYKSDDLEGSLKWGAVMYLMAGVMTNNQEALKLIPPEKLPQIQDFVNETIQIAKNEAFAELVKEELSYSLNSPAGESLSYINTTTTN